MLSSLLLRRMSDSNGRRVLMAGGVSNTVCLPLRALSREDLEFSRWSACRGGVSSRPDSRLFMGSLVIDGPTVGAN